MLQLEKRKKLLKVQGSSSYKIDAGGRDLVATRPSGERTCILSLVEEQSRSVIVGSA